MTRFASFALGPVLSLALAACAVGTAGVPPSAPPTGRAASAPTGVTAASVFFSELSALCGQRFAGQVVSTDSADDNFRGKALIMQVRDCSDDEIGIPFAVGEDRSRRWVITRTQTGLRLKHDHRDPAGEIHGYHMYGGDTVTVGTATRQEFPVDQASIDQFIAGGATVSTTNVWAMEVHPGQMFAYELRRPEGRFFRVEFDLAHPLP